ncbi:MAG: hypothetical protein QG646_679, partial [Euryarchaeota archaeon]|nr:hypothetical protein [Euryarchaeota archaeon]
MKVYRTQHTEYIVKTAKNEFKSEKNELALEGKGDLKEMMIRMSRKWSAYIGDTPPL